MDIINRLQNTKLKAAKQSEVIKNIIPVKKSANYISLLNSINNTKTNTKTNNDPYDIDAIDDLLSEED